MRNLPHSVAPRELMTHPTPADAGPTATPSSGNQRQTQLLTREAELGARGLVRVNMILPVSHNNYLKALARKAGKNADLFIGEHYMQLYRASRHEEAIEEAARLKERFGDDWFEILASVPLRPHS